MRLSRRRPRLDTQTLLVQSMAMATWAKERAEVIWRTAHSNLENFCCSKKFSGSSTSTKNKHTKYFQCTYYVIKRELNYCRAKKFLNTNILHQYFRHKIFPAKCTVAAKICWRIYEHDSSVQWARSCIAKQRVKKRVRKLLYRTNRCLRGFRYNDWFRREIGELEGRVHLSRGQLKLLHLHHHVQIVQHPRNLQLQ